jgi:predicted ATPase
MLHVLTYRPEFDLPWPVRSYMTPLTLNRLERQQVEALICHLAGGKALPADVVKHIVAKTDGVPLYVEELTKMLLESSLLREEADHYTLTGPLSAVTIPATLQDSLMARLDQLNTAKEVAQLGAVIGREFSYEMLQALVAVEEGTLQDGLAQLVAAELLYQRGRPPRATSVFKHALIQDAAYASLLRSTRPQVHQRVARLLEARFPEVVETEPELLAHHFEHGDLAASALGYWLRAGRRAAARSANVEAVNHLQRALTLIPQLSDPDEAARRELDIQLELGVCLMATHGYAPSLLFRTGRPKALDPGEPLRRSRTPSSAGCLDRALPRYA